MATVQPVLVSRSTIKPSTPTPEDLKTHNLSFLEHITPALYARNILFFANKHNPITTSDLKESLSRVLAKYYPFAGRAKEKLSIDCNDEGVEFFEARIACNLAEVLENPDIESLSRFLPLSNDSFSKEYDLKAPVLINVTLFDCGGMAIGTWFTGKVADSYSISAFMKDWASVTLDPTLSLSPQFIGATLLPVTSNTMIPIPLPDKPSFPTRRLVFTGSKIEALKASLGSNDPPASDVVISALIFRCLASAMQSSGLHKKRLLSYMVNLRQIIVPPLSENTIGNLGARHVITLSEEEVELQGVLGKLRAGLAEVAEKYSKKETEDAWSVDMYRGFLKLIRMYLTEPTEVIVFSSLCKLPFYEVDFGSGKPVWMGMTWLPVKNCCVICESKGGEDIEVWVSSDDEILDILERNEELLSYASLNPTVPFN